jgi:hypothetical protein
VRIAAVIVLGVLGLRSSCKQQSRPTFRPGTGDLGQFILAEVVKRGGRPASARGLPAIAKQWQYSEDEAGVIIRTAIGHYPAIERFLQQAFGRPSIPPTVTTDGGLLGVYGVKAVGVGIQFGHDTKEAQVIVVRPISQEELAEGLKRALRNPR